MAFAAPPPASLDSKAVCVGAGLAREFANFRRRGSVVKQQSGFTEPFLTWREE